jgi:hypothetical protein
MKVALGVRPRDSLSYFGGWKGSVLPGAVSP